MGPEASTLLDAFMGLLIINNQRWVKIFLFSGSSSTLRTPSPSVIASKIHSCASPSAAPVRKFVCSEGVLGIGQCATEHGELSARLIVHAQSNGRESPRLQGGMTCFVLLVIHL